MPTARVQMSVRLSVAVHQALVAEAVRSGEALNTLVEQALARAYIPQETSS